MNEYEQEYLKKKNSVLNCLENAKEFLNKFGYEYELEVVSSHSINLENGEFSIVLVGEFSAGKSTFLNALMGEKILPSFSSETTATVNFLKHKNKAKNNEGGCVYYRNGTTKLIDNADFETISKYVSTGSEEEVAKNISHLDLYLDSKFLENNVTLIDSPGLNGIADGHREITEEQIMHSTASIFLFNANQPGSSTDFEFLKNLQKHIKGIICVLNQIDCIKTTEGQTVESVISKLKENYKKMIPDAKTIPEIIPVAAYPALVARGQTEMEYNGKTEFSIEEKQHFEEISRMQELENRLWRFLTQGEKTKQELLTPIKQLEAILIKIQDNKKSEKKILEGKEDIYNLEEQKLKLEEQKEKLNDEQKEKRKKIKRKVKCAKDELIEEIDSKADDLKKEYIKKLDAWEEIEEIDPDNIKKNVEKALNRISDEAIDNFRESISEIIDSYESSAVESINERLDNNNFKFTIDNEIEKSKIKLGFEKYEEEVKKLEKELKELEERKDLIDGKIVEAMELEDQYNKKNRELEYAKRRKEDCEERLQEGLPEADRITEKIKEKIPNQGVLGGIHWILAGDKYEWVEKTRIDTSRRDLYKRDYEKIIEKCDKEIKEKEKEVQEMDSTSPEKKRMLERKQKEIEKMKEQKQAELKALHTNFKENSKEQIEKVLKRQKRAVEEFIDNNVEQFSTEFKKEFRTYQDTIVNFIIDIVMDSIRLKIEVKTKEIEILQNKMETAMNDKENTLNQINNELENIQPILLEVLNLGSELEDIKVDTIKEEDL